MAAMRFSELVQKASVKQTMGLSPDGSAAFTEKDFTQFCSDITVMNELMSTKGTYHGPRVSLSEALRSPDASILFPKVISDVLLRPKEPMMIGQTLLAKTVMVDGTRSVEFPTLGAIRAFDMSDTQEYREQLPAFTEHLTEVKVNKVGLALSISEEVIEDSMWDVLALFLEAAGYAMLRHKEEKIFKEFQSKAHVVYDNGQALQSGLTHGRNYSQALNYSATYDDFIDAMGALVANEYIPTDIIMHPLAWVVFAKDPILRNVMYTQGQIGQSIWTQTPQFDQSVNVPWNINYQVTPFVPFQLETQLPSTSPGSGSVACNISDVYIIDRQNACVVLQRDTMSIEKFEDPRRDIQSAKLKERYGVGALNGGRAAASIKNIRLEQNWAPINTILNVPVPT